MLLLNYYCVCQPIIGQVAPGRTLPIGSYCLRLLITEPIIANVTQITGRVNTHRWIKNFIRIIPSLSFFFTLLYLTLISLSQSLREDRNEN